MIQPDQPVSLFGGGRPVICPHCGDSGFVPQWAGVRPIPVLGLIGKPLNYLVPVEFPDSVPRAYSCDTCGLVQWFVPTSRDNGREGG